MIFFFLINIWLIYLSQINIFIQWQLKMSARSDLKYTLLTAITMGSRSLTGQIRRTRPWRRTCSPGLRARRWGPCMGACAGYSTLLGLVEAHVWVHQVKCKAITNNIYKHRNIKNTHENWFLLTAKLKRNSYISENVFIL